MKDTQICRTGYGIPIGIQGFSVRFFFFQAEDGIRDGHVTGVQTCALPISSQRAATCSWVVPCTRWLATPHTQARNCALKSSRPLGSRPCSPQRKFRRTYFTPDSTLPLVCARYGRHSRGVKPQYRSEERRVGKECRVR